MVRSEILNNDLRVITERIPSVKSVALGVWLGVGSRDESKSEHGISHFIEHMFFKGTTNRSAREIAQRIDSVGGELNAFTTRETTTFYAKVLDTHLPVAVDLLADILQHSLFDRHALEKEKQVVAEEIRMVEDDPEEHLHDLHAHHLWRPHALSRPIQGSLNTVRAVTRKTVLQYITRHYQPQNMVIAVAGGFEPATLSRLLRRAFGQYGNGVSPGLATRAPRAKPVMRTGVHVHQRDIEQVHLCVSTASLCYGHADRYGALLLNAILGGSISSRLFQEVRERRGLAYSIYSHQTSMSDVGIFNIYAATNAGAAPKVLSLIVRQLKTVRARGVSGSELERAKNQVKGNVMLGMESTTSRMAKLAKDELYLGRHTSCAGILREIDLVSRRQILRLAAQFFDGRRATLTALGPITKEHLPADALAGC